MTPYVVVVAIILAAPLCVASYFGMCRTYGVDALRPLSRGRKRNVVDEPVRARRETGSTSKGLPTSPPR